MPTTQYERIGGSQADSETVVGAIVVGIALGFVLVKSNVFLPSMILKKEFLAFFTTVVVTTMLIQAVLSAFKNERYEYSRSTLPKGNPLSVMVGSFLFGLGVALCRSTPTLTFIQLGSAITNAGFILLGGCCAVLLYGFFHEKVFSKLDDAINEMKCIDEYVKAEYWMVALPMSVLFGVLLFLFPWDGEFSYNKIEDWIPDPRKATWQPYLAGVMVGILQLPTTLLVKQRLASMCSYITPISMAVNEIAKASNRSSPPFFQHHASGYLMWQLILMVTAMTTTAIMTGVSNTYGPEHGVGYGQAFGYGLLMHLGALIAGGGILEFCVAGLADLQVSSYIGVCGFLLSSMFIQHMPAIRDKAQSYYL